jgi:hypothetical protein
MVALRASPVPTSSFSTWPEKKTSPNKEINVSRATPKLTAASVFLFTVIAGCGGKVSTPANELPPGANYSFVTPKAGAQSTFADTIVDNLANTVNRTLVENITAVNADGTFTASWNDPSMLVTVAGTVDQTFYPTVTQYNNVGQTTSYVVTPYSGSASSCIAAPHLGEQPSPLTQSQNWTVNYTLTCDSNAPVSYAQVGAFQDMEQLTTTAGIFNAYRFTSVITYTDAGQQVKKYVTTWVNAAVGDSRVLQESVFYTYFGTAPQGSILSDTKALTSFH